MKKKGLLLFLLLAAFGFSSRAGGARVPILGTHAAFSLSDRWKYLSTTDLENNAKSYLYCYTIPQSDGRGDTVLPYLRVVVRKGYAGSALDYAFSRYMKAPFEPLDDYVSGLGLPKSGGIGYVGAYTNPHDGKDYQFRMVYFKEKDVVVELRLETTQATYPGVEKEFEAVLRSLTFGS